VPVRAENQSCCSARSQPLSMWIITAGCAVSVRTASVMPAHAADQSVVSWVKFATQEADEEIEGSARPSGYSMPLWISLPSATIESGMLAATKEWRVELTYPRSVAK
jgi:hypothetical protein